MLGQVELIDSLSVANFTLSCAHKQLGSPPLHTHVYSGDNYIWHANSFLSLYIYYKYASGGFSKYPDGYPDALHAYMGLAGLSVIGHPQLKPLDARINISTMAMACCPH